MTQQKLVTVKLKATHTHADKSYASGDELSVSQQDADWLVANGVGEASASVIDDSKPGKKS